MKILAVCFVFIVLSFKVSGQGNIMLMPLEPLTNATWKSEGTWKNGDQFKQEVTYGWADDNESVTVSTKSYLDSTFSDFGQFSEGAHTWDTISNTIAFEIKDVDGKVVNGTVHTRPKAIMYEYVKENKLGMKTYMTDAIIWIKPDKYLFKVGTMKDDVWEEVYLESYFFKVKD